MDFEREDKKIKHERLALRDDVLLLRVCIEESEGDKAEALMDFNLIKDMLELQNASKIVPSYWRNGQSIKPKKWLQDALLKRITDDVIARQPEDPERDELRKILYPVTPNRPLVKSK